VFVYSIPINTDKIQYFEHCRRMDDDIGQNEFDKYDDVFSETHNY